MLHIGNNEGMYHITREEAESFIAGKAYREYESDHGAGEVDNYELGEHIAGYWKDAIEELGGIQDFRDEVGSWWRLDYGEIGDAVREWLD